jgi:hypothetical protein
MSFKSRKTQDTGLIKLNWRVSLAVLFLTLGMHAMAAPDDRAITAASNVVVTLFIFSGFPDPAWTLAEGSQAELLRRLQALEVSKVAGDESGGLGYTAVAAKFQDETKRTITVRAWRGIVTLDRGGEKSHYADPGRQFELWLVNTGAAHVSPDIIKHVTAEIAKPLQ